MILTKLTFRNIGSYGNIPTVVEFNPNDRLVGIIGENGNGKSFISDAIMYGLYGVPFRKIKKSDLVNKINKSGLYVCVEFISNNEYWAIERTLKDIQIYRGLDKIPVDMDAHILDIQKYINNNIIGSNENIFRTVSMLSMRNFRSFFSYPRDKRRELFESLIGVGVFTSLKKVFQNQLNSVENKCYGIEREMETIQYAIKNASENISKITEMENTSNQDTEKYLNKIISEYEEKKQQRDKLGDHNILEKQKNEQSEQLNEIVSNIRILNRDMANAKGDIDFFETHDVCPRCKKSLSKKEKDDEIQKINKRINSIEKELSERSNIEEEIKNKIDNLKEQINKIQNINRDIDALSVEIKSTEKIISNINIVKNDANIKYNISSQIEEFNKKLNSLSEEFQECIEFKETMELFKKIVSDNGLKQYVYGKFLPHLNYFVNNVLRSFDFNISFEITNTLDGIIRDRWNNEVDINSFSNGEQQLIDVSFMFGLQQFLTQINNYTCELCFIDELFDASLDVNNLDKIVDFMRNNLTTSQIIIITHKLNIKENFDKCFHVIKTDGFSQIFVE